MRDTNFYNRLLNLTIDWEVFDLEIDDSLLEIVVHVRYVGETAFCPLTDERCPVHDYNPVRRWRHLDTMQYKTFLSCKLPRVINSESKVTTVKSPWADYSDRYTCLFRDAVIELLQFCKNQTKTALFFRISFRKFQKFRIAVLFHYGKLNFQKTQNSR